jgi:hypothetical protein
MAGGIIILSALKDLVGVLGHANTTEILRCAQNDVSLDFAVLVCALSFFPRLRFGLV